MSDPTPVADPLLSVEGVNTFYGPVQVHFDLSFTVGRGQIVCLLGGNASGKSTTMKIILGLVKPTSGVVRFAGEPITGLTTPQIVRRGVGSVPEARRLFGDMSVRENLLMGAFSRSGPLEADIERVYDLFPRLKERRSQKAGTLSGGEQQMLAIGRALMAEPQVLLLDEPSMGLSPILTEQIFKIITDINAQGTTILLVEQNAQMAFNVASRGYVLQTGQIILADTAANLAANVQVRQAYLGEI